MTRLVRILLLLPLLLPVATRAQVTSSDCIADLEKAFALYDAQVLMGQGGQSRMRFTHQFIMRKDEEGKTVTQEESMVYGPKFYRYDTPEFLEVSDAAEGFHWRKHQRVVYRMGSSVSKSAQWIPGMDKGFFQTCVARLCEFREAPGKDTLRYKHAILNVSPEGQKKYQIREMELLWNPITYELVTIGVSFTERSIYKWAQWDIHSVGPQEPGYPVDAKAGFLDGGGKLLPDFNGVELQDVR
ncbi:MAG: hypothetical protein U0176_16605 [Bacteroidia bacterium]